MGYALAGALGILLAIQLSRKGVANRHLLVVGSALVITSVSFLGVLYTEEVGVITGGCLVAMSCLFITSPNGALYSEIVDRGHQGAFSGMRFIALALGRIGELRARCSFAGFRPSLLRTAQHPPVHKQRHTATEPRPTPPPLSAPPFFSAVGPLAYGFLWDGARSVFILSLVFVAGSLAAGLACVMRRFRDVESRRATERKYQPVGERESNAGEGEGDAEEGGQKGERPGDKRDGERCMADIGEG